MAEKQLDSQAYLKKILLARIYDLVKEIGRAHV